MITLRCPDSVQGRTVDISHKLSVHSGAGGPVPKAHSFLRACPGLRAQLIGAGQGPMQRIQAFWGICRL